MAAMEYSLPDFILPGVAGVAPPAGGRSRSEIELGKVFVGGLARETTTEGLRGYFERFGDISDCVVMKDRSTGLPRGFGFVTYVSQLVADRVVHHRHVLDGKEVEAKPAVPRDSEMLARPGGAPGGLAGLAGLPNLAGPGFAPASLSLAAPGPANFSAPPAGQSGAESSKKIFVGGLSHETSEADFIAYFGLYGQVVDCVIMCDPHTRKPRGFGFVTYDSTVAVDRACVNKFHELNGKRVEVKRAIPQDRMAAEENTVKQDPNVLATLAGGLFAGLAPNSAALGLHGAAPHPGFASNLPAANLLAQTVAAQAQAQMAGWTPPNDTGGGGLDAALSTANSVLAPSMAEPPSDSKPSSHVPAGIFNAFNNPNGNNFSSATVALSTGLRAGYGTENGGVKAPPGSQAPNSSVPAAPPTTTAPSAESNAQVISQQAHQLAAAQQQQQVQNTLLQFQQQQILLQQVQQRQRQQQQLQQLEQLQNLQQALLQVHQGNGGAVNGGAANGAPHPAGIPQQVAAVPAAPPNLVPSAGVAPPAGDLPAANGATPSLEQQLMMLSMTDPAAAANSMPPPAATVPTSVPTATAAGSNLPGFEPATSLPQFLP